MQKLNTGWRVSTQAYRGGRELLAHSVVVIFGNLKNAMGEKYRSEAVVCGGCHYVLVSYVWDACHFEFCLAALLNIQLPMNRSLENLFLI